MTALLYNPHISVHFCYFQYRERFISCGHKSGKRSLLPTENGAGEKNVAWKGLDHHSTLDFIPQVIENIINIYVFSNIFSVYSSNKVH